MHDEKRYLSRPNTPVYKEGKHVLDALILSNLCGQWLKHVWGWAYAETPIVYPYPIKSADMVKELLKELC